jgi:hypothetical protein
MELFTHEFESGRILAYGSDAAEAFAALAIKHEDFIPRMQTEHTAEVMGFLPGKLHVHAPLGGLDIESMHALLLYKADALL